MAGLFLFRPLSFLIGPAPLLRSDLHQTVPACHVVPIVSTYQSRSTHTNTEPPRVPLKSHRNSIPFSEGIFPSATLAMPDTSVGNSLAIFLSIWLFQLEAGRPGGQIFQWNFFHSFRISQEKESTREVSRSSHLIPCRDGAKDIQSRNGRGAVSIDRDLPCRNRQPNKPMVTKLKSENEADPQSGPSFL